MARRKIRQSRHIGLKPNMLCPYCKRKVKQAIELPAGHFIEHWWSKVICSKYTKPPTKIEEMMDTKFKSAGYNIKIIADDNSIGRMSQLQET